MSEPELESVSGTVTSVLQKLEEDIEKGLEMQSSRLLRPGICSIYRVPDKIRKLNEDAYTPHVVSIGPFHHGKKEFNFMERHKLRFLGRFRERKFSGGLSEFVDFLETHEDIIREFYSETFDDLKSEEFIRMITVDTIFILELLYDSDTDQIFKENEWVLDATRRDLILLENQLPYPLLEWQYEKSYAERIDQAPSFFDLVCGFFEEHRNRDSNSAVTSTEDFKHFTDVIRIFYKPSTQICPPSRSVTIHSASKLHEAGVKFKKLESKRTLFDVHVEFSGGVLRMARFQVVEKMESLLRNLMALEQWCYPSGAYICQYVSLLDHLIDSTNDVDLLVEADILSHRLGTSNAVVSLINKLCINIETSTNTETSRADILSHRLGTSNAVVSLIYKLCINIETSTNTERSANSETSTESCSNQSRLYEDLDEYFNKPWHRWKAIFIHEYFNTPFKIASTTTAVIFLVLTFIQTVFSIVKN